MAALAISRRRATNFRYFHSGRRYFHANFIFLTVIPCLPKTTQSMMHRPGHCEKKRASATRWLLLECHLDGFGLDLIRETQMHDARSKIVLRRFERLPASQHCDRRGPRGDGDDG